MRQSNVRTGHQRRRARRRAACPGFAMLNIDKAWQYFDG